MLIVKDQSYMHTITNLWKFELNWSSKLREKNGRKKTPLSHKLCAFRCLEFETLAEVSISIQIFYWEVTSFSKAMLLQRTALYCSLPSKFLCEHLFWVLPIVSSAFKGEGIYLNCILSDSTHQLHSIIVTDQVRFHNFPGLVGNYSKIFFSIKTYLVTISWAFDSIKHCEKRLPLKYSSFRERSNFPRTWFRDLRLTNQSPNQASENTT